MELEKKMEDLGCNKTLNFRSPGDRLDDHRVDDFVLKPTDKIQSPPREIVEALGLEEGLIGHRHFLQRAERSPCAVVVVRRADVGYQHDDLPPST